MLPNRRLLDIVRRHCQFEKRTTTLVEHRVLHWRTQMTWRLVVEVRAVSFRLGYTVYPLTRLGTMSILPFVEAYKVSRINHDPSPTLRGRRTNLIL